MATFLEGALALLNEALVWIADSTLAPIVTRSPVAGLAMVSLVTAAAMLFVIAKTSNQRRVAEIKRCLQADLLEIRLLNDDPLAVVRALGDALRHNAVYLALWVVPLLWMSIPLALVVTHLQPFYGYTGLEPGVPALLKAELRGEQVGRRSSDVELALDPPAAIHLETGAVRLPAANEVVWRIVPTRPGDFTVSVREGQSTMSKSLHVGDRPARRSPQRVAPSVIDQLLYPSEATLDVNSPIAAIVVTYPDSTIDVLGFRVHWTVAYLVLSMAWALVLARRFRIIL